MGERPPRCVEARMGKPHRVARLAVHDFHGENRLSLRGDRLPGADAFEKLARPVGDGDGPQERAAGVGRGERSRIDDGDRNPVS